MPINIQYQNKYICFLDVLGFTEYVEANKPGTIETLEKFYNSINQSFNILTGGGLKYNKIVVSDSIIITTEDSVDGLRILLEAVRMLQVYLLRLDFTLRGGIAYGLVDIQEAENIIVGPGYLKAVKLEKQANFAKVLIHQEIINDKFPLIFEDLKQNYLMYQAHRLLYKNDEGQWMVEYAEMALSLNETEAIYNLIKANINGNCKEKYEWLKNYFAGAFYAHGQLLKDSVLYNIDHVKEAKEWEEKFKAL